MINETFQYSVSEKAGKLLERIDVCFELRTSNAHTLQPGVSGGSAIFSDPNRQKKTVFSRVVTTFVVFFKLLLTLETQKRNKFEFSIFG